MGEALAGLRMRDTRHRDSPLVRNRLRELVRRRAAS
jgi:hypothetical protein